MTDEQEIFARKRSAGGDNGYSMKCGTNIVGYSTCQHIIRAAAEKRLRGFEHCVASMKAKTCPALAMMREEQTANRALYYKPYGIIKKWLDESLGICTKPEPITKLFSRTRPTEPKPEPGYVEFDISKIVTETLKL